MDSKYLFIYASVLSISDKEFGRMQAIDFE
jgi:hypothetical protein